MARIVLIKPFTGLNLAVAQLSAELLRAGHETRIIYFKKFLAVPCRREKEFVVPPYPSRGTFIRGEEWIWNCHEAATEKEYELLVEEIRAFGADLVGLSLISSSMPFGAEITARLRSELGVPIIWGGAGPTLEPEKAIVHADLVCVGEGEAAIVEVASRIQDGRSTDDIPGVWARVSETIVRNGRTASPVFEQIAIPNFERARAVYIDEDTRQANYYPNWVFNQYIIMTQRGCPFSCSFCVESRYQDIFGKSGSVRRRSVDVVIDELVQAREQLGFRSVMFYDDVFTTHRPWLAEFARKYSQRVGLPFWCYTYPTTTRRDDVRLLRDAGLQSMTMGLQSGSQRILNEYFNRPAPLSRSIDAAEMIMGEGVKLFFDLISKVPWETEEDLKSTFELLLRFPRGIKLVGIGYMVPYPTYGYSERVETEQPVFAISDTLYAYYHRLYTLAVSDLPLALKRAIASEPIYRKRPELLDGLMPSQIDFHYLVNDDERQARRKAQPTIDLGFAQTVLADDRTRVTPQTTMQRPIASSDPRRLPLVAT